MTTLTRRRSLAVASLVALTGLSVAYGPELSASARPRATYVRHLTAGSAAFHQVDNAPSGDSPGDEVVDTFSLSHAGRKAGTLMQYCVLTDADRGLAQCNGSMLLHDGGITFGGPVTASDVTRMAVLGGTRRYHRAGGTVVFTPDGEKVRVALHLRGVR